MISHIEELETVFDAFEPSLPEKRTREYRLERMTRLLDAIGHPEESYRTYHVAGSKGKGTTSAYLAALLKGAGRKCGLYGSPHLFSVRERFTLSGEFFQDDFYIDVCNDLIGRVRDFRLPSALGPEKPTEFEMYTAYGYMLFREAGCTDAVIETGLGGRLDATNTLKPEAVFLTPIELEHTDILGHTIREIATEKSKIITPGTPVFVSLQKQEAADVFRKEAESKGSPITFLSDVLSGFTTDTKRDGEYTAFSIGGTGFSLHLEMATEAMAENAALAILGAERLSFLTEKGLENLERTQLPGRFERRMYGSRLVVIDTAHTEASAASARKAFMEIASPCPTLIFGLVSGKDALGIARTLLPPFSHVIISRPGTYRKSNPEELWEMARSLFPDKDIRLIEDPDEALGSALSIGSDILITGSFYLAGAMKELRKDNES